MNRFHPIVPSSLTLIIAFTMACASPTLPPKAGGGSGEDTSGTIADAAEPGDAQTQDASKADSLGDAQLSDAHNSTSVDAAASDADGKCTGGAIEGCPCDIKKDKAKRCCLQIDSGLACAWVGRTQRHEWGEWWDGCGCKSEISGGNAACVPKGIDIFPLCPSTVDSLSGG